MDHAAAMRLAVEKCRQGIAKGQSPFGAVIVRGDEVIATAHNEVWDRCDPTCHAEVNCIRKAADRLQTIDLSECVMYSTCEPCPMCLAAIHWSKLRTVYYGASIADAQAAGYSELAVPASELARLGGSHLEVVPGVLAETCRALFDEWRRAGGKPAF